MTLWPAAIASAESRVMMSKSAHMCQKPLSAWDADTFPSFVMRSAQCWYHTS